jgi:hypothetical protein
MPERGEGLLDLPGASRLSPELRALLLLARLDPPAADLQRAADMAGRADFDWARLAGLAWRLWIHPLVARSLLDSRGPFAKIVPMDVRTFLAPAALVARSRWSSYRDAVAPLLRAWDARGVKPAILKGAALGLTTYPTGARLLNDLDLWVPSEAFDEAAADLAAAGFTRRSPGHGSAEEDRREHVGWSFARDAGGVGELRVDLHYRLHPGHSPFHLDPRVCAERGWTVSLDGVPVRVFRPEDAVVHLGIQMAGDVYVKVQTVADLHAILSRPGVDFAALERCALDAGAGGPAALALRWARAAGAPIPDGLEERLEGSSPAYRWATAILTDARTVDPERSMRAAATLSLEALYAPTGSERRRLLRRIPLVVAERQKRAGVNLLSRGWRSVRAIPLTALMLGLAGTSAFAARRWPALSQRLTGLVFRHAAWSPAGAGRQTVGGR